MVLYKVQVVVYTGRIYVTSMHALGCHLLPLVAAAGLGVATGNTHWRWTPTAVLCFYSGLVLQ